jgi:hypothetical protein
MARQQSRAPSLSSGFTIHRVLRPTEAPPFMRGYPRADLPYEQPTKTEPDGEFGSYWQDDIIINHCHCEPCHPPKNAVITIHKITHHAVLSDGKTPHDFMASSYNCSGLIMRPMAGTRPRRVNWSPFVRRANSNERRRKAENAELRAERDELKARLARLIGPAN